MEYKNDHWKKISNPQKNYTHTPFYKKNKFAKDITHNNSIVLNIETLDVIEEKCG